jgi:NAD(P)-dependent dehydrogenase (short-subunit alcohol dehydrogenase family)
VANGVTVLVGSRNFKRGGAAAKEIGAGAIPLQFDVTDRVSIADGTERIREEFGRLDLLVQNAALSNTRKGSLPMQEYFKISRASNASLDEVRAVWETNVLGVLAVYQAMLPIMRKQKSGVSCRYRPWAVGWRVPAAPVTMLRNGLSADSPNLSLKKWRPLALRSARLNLAECERTGARAQTRTRPSCFRIMNHRSARSCRRWRLTGVTRSAIRSRWLKSFFAWRTAIGCLRIF